MTSLRTSERNLFKRCQWAWERSYIDRLADKESFSTALWFGTGIHLALEKYYLKGTERGPHPSETWEKYCNETLANTKFINTYEQGDFSEAVNAKELGTLMLNEYISEYGDDKHMSIIGVEIPFNIAVPFDNWWQDIDGQTHKTYTKGGFVGTIDLVYRDLRDNKIYLMDHKTCKALGSANTQFLPLDDQAGGYCAAAQIFLKNKGLISEDDKIAGIMYNYLVKKKPDMRPRNADGLATNAPQKKHYVAQLTGDNLDKMKLDDLKSLAEQQGVVVLGEVSKQQPTPMFDRVLVKKHRKQLISQARRVRLDLEAMSLVRNGVIKATKSPTRECGFCQFRELCELDESGKDWKGVVDQMFTTWNPYEAHDAKDS